MRGRGHLGCQTVWGLRMGGGDWRLEEWTRPRELFKVYMEGQGLDRWETILGTRVKGMSNGRCC